MNENFVIESVGNFKVVRDDLYEGGTKLRAFRNLIGSIKEEELVYACDYFGYASYAISLAAKEVNKKVTLFYCSPKQETLVFSKTISLPNVNYKIINEVTTQMEVAPFAEKYAIENSAKYLPIGLDFPEFLNELSEVVKSANIDAPEIWCLGGSGTLGRSLQMAYPEIPVNIVNLGTKDFNPGNNKYFDAPEKWNESAQIKPPYPSTEYLDAKVWRFISENGKSGAVVWNVA